MPGRRLEQSAPLPPEQQLPGTNQTDEDIFDVLSLGEDREKEKEENNQTGKKLTQKKPP